MYGDLCMLTDSEMEGLCNNLNDSIDTCIINEDWVYSYLIPLPKPGKDPLQIQDCRATTMQNALGKLLEKLVARKLVHQLDKQHPHPTNLRWIPPK